MNIYEHMINRLITLSPLVNVTTVRYKTSHKQRSQKYESETQTK